MLYGLAIVFIPLFLGYAFLLSDKKLLYVVNRITVICLYLILLVMGISLGQLDNLMEKLPQIGAIAAGASLILHLSNLLFLMLFDRLKPMESKQAPTGELPSRLSQLFESVKLLITTFVGVLIGFAMKGVVDFPFHASTYVLVVMIFFVGIHLRNSGIPLREVFLNKKGIITSLLFIASGLAGGVVMAFALDLPMARALAIASGFGWYSLSSVLINDAWGPVYGSIAFFNDLSREIMCLFLIPFFMQRYPATAVSVAGATALDCTLPIIQKAGGIQMVPFAISFGFIVNIVSPILLAFFIGLG